MATNVIAKPLPDITAENYAEKAKAFITLKGSSALVACRSGSCQGVRYEADLKRWGAWLSYFKWLKCKTHFMESREFYTVPADWPHQFDAGMTMEADVEAGEIYLGEVRRKIAKQFDTDRLIKGAAVKRWRTDKWKGPTPPEHIAMEGEPALPAHHDPDELRASMGRLNERIDL